MKTKLTIFIFLGLLVSAFYPPEQEPLYFLSSQTGAAFEIEVKVNGHTVLKNSPRQSPSGMVSVNEFLKKGQNTLSVVYTRITTNEKWGPPRGFEIALHRWSSQDDPDSSHELAGIIGPGADYAVSGRIQTIEKEFTVPDNLSSKKPGNPYSFNGEEQTQSESNFKSIPFPLKGWDITRMMNELRSGKHYSESDLVRGPVFRESAQRGDFSSCAQSPLQAAVITTSDEQKHKISFTRKGGKIVPVDATIPWGSSKMTTHWTCHQGGVYLHKVSGQWGNDTKTCEVPFPMAYCEFGNVVVWQAP